MKKGKTIQEISIGDSYEHEFTVTEKMIADFAAATGDNNPVHLDEEFAKTSIFKTRVAHGMLTAGFVSAVMGTMFPGTGSIYISQTLEFRRPVFIGDCITVLVTVTDRMEEKNRLRLDTVCTNQDGREVLTGQAEMMPPR